VYTVIREWFKSKLECRSRKTGALQIQLNMPLGEEKITEKQIARWIICGTGNLHIYGTCPSCHSIQGGLLFSTVAATFMGVTTAKCTDCSETYNYYVDAREQGIWKMEAIVPKRSSILT